MFYSGVVVDSKTNKPIAGVTISKLYGSDNNVPVTQTLQNGSFAFNADGHDFQVAFSSVGYYPVSIDPDIMAAAPGGVVSLDPGSAETLDPVTVTPTLKKGLGILALLVLGYYMLKD